VRDRGLEGIVAKRVDSRYEPGVRSGSWRKIPAYRWVRTVVGGFTKGEGGRSGTFGALLVGLWTGGRLRYVGSLGSGFSDRDLGAIREALDEMTVDEAPFIDPAGLPRGATFVVPSLVAAVQFREWTSAGRLRGPSFKGFTDDPLDSVTWDEEGPASRH
jgi:bifunctional non-homologous end joining protein LigD